MTVMPRPELTPATSRRTILKMSAVTGGGLILGFQIGQGAEAQAATGSFEPNAYLEIKPTGRIRIYSTNPEVGQGVKTSLPMIVAEELDAAWADVDAEQAPIKPEVYGWQAAGGSLSILRGWDALRTAGASARHMLVAAAAESWDVDAAACRTADSHVIHPDGVTKVAYAELVDRAAAMPVPDEVTFKAREDYTLLGSWIGGVDNDKLVTGQPLFAADQVQPDMVYATYTKCPAFGGTVASANLDEVRQMPGILDAFVIEGTRQPAEISAGVAIVADSTWSAMRAKSALEIEWDETDAAKDSWSSAAATAGSLAGSKGEELIHSAGDVDAALQSAAVTVEATYSYPFIAHVPMEPQNCLAWHKGDSVEIWSGTQRPAGAVDFVSRIFDLPKEQVLLHQLRGGGGFGRRLYNDFVCEAVAISQRVGAPVKLQWTREDDTRHDHYRVGGFHHLKGAVDADGKLTAISDHFVTFSADGEKPVSGGNISADEFPLQLIDHAEITQTMLPWRTPCGALRAPRSNAFGFVFQSFLYELAEASGQDYVEFLIGILGEPRWLDPGNLRVLHTGRTADVIKLVAEKSGWGQARSDGHHLGLGFYFSHAAHVAVVAEVSAEGGQGVRVHKATVAADVGPIVNMSGAKNQIEGSVVDAVSTMFGQTLTFEGGRVKEGNFDQYPLLRMADAPHVDVHFIQSDNQPTGLGEPALPPAIPAVANAIYEATGRRIRSLPLSLEGFAV
jgi:isoquinoline 1-oxidoreductase beta subunit